MPSLFKKPESDAAEEAAPSPIVRDADTFTRPLTLDEFALMYYRAAEVETLGAFLRLERAAGRVLDAPEQFLARLSAFQHEVH